MISLQQRCTIRNEIDIINMRMAVREFARRCGFGLRDQACISLVSASLAASLGLGKESLSIGAEILMESCESDRKQGVRISCTKHHAKMGDQEVHHRLKSSYLLVDDIQVNAVSLDGIEVIVTKWDSTYTQRS